MLPLRVLALLLCFYSLSGAAGALTFEEAEKAMLAANPQAASAYLDRETARSRVTAARAGFYPSFSASASYNRSGSQGLPAGDSYGYGFSGSQPLFSPSVPAALSSAKASLRITEASYDRTASGLRFQLKSAFADILNARETLKLSGKTLERRAENLELIRLKYQAGRENKAALLETEAVLKTARWQHERYRKNLRLLERTLNRLLGRPAQSPAPELVLEPTPGPPEDFSVFARRLENHHSLRSARAALDSSAAALAGAKGARLPDASASGSYRWSGGDWPASLNSWSLGASLSLPLFSGGRLSAGLAAAKTALRAAMLDPIEALRYE